MANASVLNQSKKHNLQGQRRCPTCGRRQINRPPRNSPIADNGEVGELEQLVETMDLNEIAALLGISRSELVKRCRSLGISVDGTGEDDE